VHRRISHVKTDQCVKYKYLLFSNCIDMHKFKISQRKEIIIFHFLKINCLYDYFFLLVYYYISWVQPRANRLLFSRKILNKDQVLNISTLITKPRNIIIYQQKKVIIQTIYFQKMKNNNFFSL
jgi:hypothetical protein